MTLDPRILRGLLERAISPQEQRSVPILDVRCSRLDGAGWYASYRVLVRLEDGSEHHLFLKDFSTPRGKLTAGQTV